MLTIQIIQVMLLLAANLAIDRRVMEAIEMEDGDIIADLRHLNKNGSDKYSVFWTHCRAYLDECTAVQERRHDSVCTYMAKAISCKTMPSRYSTALRTVGPSPISP